MFRLQMLLINRTKLLTVWLIPRHNWSTNF